MARDPSDQQSDLNGFDYWRLCDELSLVQAALLIVGCDPSTEQGYAENWQLHERPKGYEAAKAAISTALRKGAIKGTVIPLYEHDMNGNICGAIDDSIDIGESRVEVASLRAWLAGRGHRTGFFFPAATGRAWQAVADPSGKHLKKADTVPSETDVAAESESDAGAADQSESPWDATPLSGIALMFDLENGDKDKNQARWRSYSKDAARNQLKSARIAAGKGTGASTFDPSKVGDWLVSKGYMERARVDRILKANLPSRSTHLRDFM